jgi:SH3 domain-containing YSC84-like protein 1
LRLIHFRQAMKRFLLLSLVALFGAAVVRAEPTRANLVDRVQTCEAILQEFSSRSAIGPSRDAWQRAKAILIVNQFKAGFLLGVQDGYGVIMVKKSSGRWSAPVLVNAGEASLGLQIGAKSIESIFLITDENTPRTLFNHRFNIGVDAKAVAGPKAAGVERDNQELLKTPLLAYAKSTGLYAGATVKAGYVSRNDTANFLLYNTKYTMPELLYSDWVNPTSVAPEVVPLMDLMQRLAP